MAVMTVADLERFLETEFAEIEHLDLRIEAAGDDGVRVRVPYRARHLRPGGTISGPTLMALADASLYLAILTRIGPVALAVTTNLTINFMRKPGQGDVVAETRLLKLGRRLAVGESVIYSDGREDPVAHAVGTYSIPPDRDRG